MGYLAPVMLNAADFGAATNRARLFVVGIHKGQRGRAAVSRSGNVLQACSEWLGRQSVIWKVPYRCRQTMVLIRGELLERVAHLTMRARLRKTDRLFTGHRRTNHSNEVVARFTSLEPGSLDKIGRHPRLTWDGQCPTLRAGTGPDKGSFQAIRPIHPEHPRVITVREAARLQGFPDWHRFHTTIWHSFRMIGNSVSPIIANALLSAVKSRIVVGSGQRKPSCYGSHFT